MHFHQDYVRTLRLIISFCQGRAKLVWQKGGQTATFEYEKGNIYNLVYKVNTKFFDNDIEHCPESEESRNVWVLNLIPKSNEPLNITPASVTSALSLYHQAIAARRDKTKLKPKQTRLGNTAKCI